MNKNKNEEILKNLIAVCEKVDLDIEISKSNKRIVIRPKQFKSSWGYTLFTILLCGFALSFFVFIFTLAIVFKSLVSLLICIVFFALLLREYIKYSKAENQITIDLYEKNIQIIKLDFIANFFIKPITLSISRNNSVKVIDRMLNIKDRYFRLHLHLKNERFALFDIENSLDADNLKIALNYFFTKIK